MSSPRPHVSVRAMKTAAPLDETKVGVGPLKISRILHAGYIFEQGRTQILFDPIFENPFSRNCFAFPSVDFDFGQIQNLRPEAVFISHFHDDHCSLDSLKHLDRATPIYIYCLHEELPEMIRALGFHRVHSLQVNKPVRIADIEVTPRRALDAEVDSMFQIKAAGVNVLNVVDSWIDWETLELLEAEGPWDVVLWPFQTMRELEVLSPSRFEPSDGKLPAEWLEQLERLNPAVVVPSSCQFIHETWSWYNNAYFPISYESFQEQVQGVLPKVRVYRLDPGASFEVSRDGGLVASTPVSWVLPVGPQDVDYEYKPDLVPPPTSAIAKNFVPLTAVQKERVLRFCESEIRTRFAELRTCGGTGADAYFAKPRHWRLCIYDENGDELQFHYLVDGFSLTLLAQTNEGKPQLEEAALGWTTELPLSKLFSALETGESLTSMYVRINDTRFSEDIENEVRGVDLLEDPLLRCLFNQAFGSYQAAQLARLL